MTNYALAISRRLRAYGNETRYSSKYHILNIAKDVADKPYHMLLFHGFGGSRLSSASPALVDDMTTVHSQLASRRNIIIDRFVVAHSHWLECNRTVKGVTFDVLGGFQRWGRSMAQRESGLIYYLYDEDGVHVHPISGLKEQINEEVDQGLHARNMEFVAKMLQAGYDLELEKGILRS